MTIYEKNLRTLSKHYPQMDVLLQKAKENFQTDLKIIEEYSFDGTPIIKVEKQGKLYYLNGKRDTTEPAKMWLKGLGSLATNAPVFMVGVGNSTYLKELVENTENHITIVIYEPCLPIFLKFLERVELEKWMEKHLLVFLLEGVEGMDSDNIITILKPLIKYELLPFSRYFVLPNYDVLFSEQVISFMKIIRDLAFRDRINYNTQSQFSKTFVKNVLNNLPYILDAYKTTQLVEVIPRDIPGIVVAAGPSLNKNINDLKLAKGRAFIIAVDTAVKPLLDAGIVPDMFALVDGEKPLMLVERDEAKQIPLIATLSAASEIFQYHTGMKFFYNEGFRYAERIFAEAEMPFGEICTGGSVATHVFSLFHKIGIQHIILVGQDLALTNNRTHADGTFQEKMEEIDTTGYMKVEGNYEKEVPIRLDFKTYLEWYNRYIKGCKENDKDFCVINATEGGARIQNTEVMTLKEAIKRECRKEVDIQECFGKLKPMLNKEGRKWSVEYIRGIPGDFKKLSIEALKTKGLYQRLDELCNKKNIDKKEYLKILNKIGESVAKIEAGDSYQLVCSTLMNAEFILKNEQFLKEESIQEEGRKVARKGVIYMESVRKCAILFEEMMEGILKKVLPILG